MSLRVLRPSDGIMMKLVKYDLISTGTNDDTSTSSIAHNHSLTPVTTVTAG